ncbi:efflux RND transporter periplasmic adaptor subunit [Pleomorphomonas oryzae]|uniref:efflux RND transporter periplasmic adaptor subunit n=1 Tax=Pleomorphomonas oryzae TaxID=261934 RepID=UPI00042684E9|nr:efflux RND transporter periplasmic adaptor subunit [Pleomorphomonas oryzae]
MARISSFISIVTCTLAALALAGCTENKAGSTDAKETTPPALVTVISVKPETVTIVDELPGRVAAFRTAEIRAQVGGIIQKRLFEQGSEVEAGQELFQINPEPFKADVDSATAALQRAEAGLVRSQTKFDRAKQLVESKAISRDAYDEAVADLAQAKANVAEARATLQRRRLDLEFATIRAPIAGRIGQALVSEGALVSASGADTLARIQQIDQVYVDVKQPASQMDVIREAEQSGQLDDASKVPVALFAASGKPYPMTGRALFSDISVDPGTGNVTVRVEVRNSNRALLPGMYVRARLPRGVRHDALLVPQEAIVRNSSGGPQLVIVDDQKKGVRRPVELGETIDGRTIVNSGLKPGETVVVQGQDRVQEDAVLQTARFEAKGAAPNAVVPAQN